MAVSTGGALGEEIARAAAKLLGTPFRLHGRHPRHGLDCMGVILCAFAAAGCPILAPPAYGLRNLSIDRHLIFVRRNGFIDATDEMRAGDVVLIAPGPAQHHLLLAENTACFIHADAGLRKVVRTRTPLRWPLVKHWRASTTV